MKIKINVSTDRIDKPIVAESILETGTLLNISQAHFDSSHGEIVADVPQNDFENFRDALISKGAKVIQLDSPVNRDDDECVDCGACVSICPKHVFKIDENWKVNMEPENCIQCGTCIKTCPHGALSIHNLMEQ
jgi:ferredoxin